MAFLGNGRIGFVLYRLAKVATGYLSNANLLHQLVVGLVGRNYFG